MRSKVWYKWPEGYIDEYLPWYLIAWRGPLAAICLFGLAIAYYSMVLAIGREEAEKLLETIF
ncbi:hypothetical protein UFOVP346_23 [uncultured Caudovirales phage]|uniref:Uncharacterized protein n=1 Tax=uncultured Caudovirales phage TaxID=2100421 RepID=A0A6J5M5Q8_9CAUD|nr:hypothetical protein UFOVP346_23 [uncultured Caudovirales phage]